MEHKILCAMKLKTCPLSWKFNPTPDLWFSLEKIYSMNEKVRFQTYSKGDLVIIHLHHVLNNGNYGWSEILIFTEFEPPASPLFTSIFKGKLWEFVKNSKMPYLDLKVYGLSWGLHWTKHILKGVWKNTSWDVLFSWASGRLGIKTFWNSPGYEEFKNVLIFIPSNNIRRDNDFYIYIMYTTYCLSTEAV